MTSQLEELDKELAHRFGEYAGYETAVSPQIKTYGDDPYQEVPRMLTHHLNSNSVMLDLGCGAGQTLCHFAPQVAEAWGFDQEPALLNGARCRAEHQQLSNVMLVEGNVAVAEDVAQLPDDHFDLIYSDRGPNMNYNLVEKLKQGGFFLQAVMQGGIQLKEILGRRPFTHHAYRNFSDRILAAMANLDIRPLSIREIFYDAFFRDVDHLAAYLSQVEAIVSDWRVGYNNPYDPDRDLPALKLYARYNTAPEGIHLLQHQIFFVGVKTRIHYYPIDRKETGG